MAHENMQKLIPVVNNLQDLLSPLGLHVTLDLPQIVVVGSQSSGKSSVLENLVGRDFLPRGQGIVTRRPLIIQLRQTRSGSDKSEYAEFTHLPNRRFEDFDEVRREIERETERVCGLNKGVSASPMTVRIFSANVVDLTLVDLPGLTKIPIGDQPADIEARIYDLVKTYVSRPGSIILAVTPANSDLANSDSLKMAREFDADGRRTIGVLTKLDMIDAGTEQTTVDVLAGSVYPLRLGYVAMVCRSQKDLGSGKRISEALKSEEAFFAAQPAFRPVMNQCGTTAASRVLNRMLIAHITETLPGLRNRIAELANSFERELAGLGEAVNLGELSTTSSNGPDAPLVSGGRVTGLALSIMNDFCRSYCDAVDGKTQSSALVGGARIHYVFADVYVKAITSFDVFSGLSDVEIRTAVRNATGPKPALFVPESAFETLVKSQIRKLEEPSLQCADLVCEELSRVLHGPGCADSAEMRRFPQLRDSVLVIAKTLLKQYLAPCKELISNMVRCEVGYINTSHPDFVGGSRAISGASHSQSKSQTASSMGGSGMGSSSMSSSLQNGRPIGSAAAHSSGSLSTGNANLANGNGNLPNGNGSPTNQSIVSSQNQVRPTLVPVPDVIRAAPEPSERERIEMEIIRSLMVSYFGIVKRNMCDFVPKAIMTFMVNASKLALHASLVSALYNESTLAKLLVEPADISEKRKRCKASLRALNNSLDVLAKLRDYVSTGPRSYQVGLDENSASNSFMSNSSFQNGQSTLGQKHLLAPIDETQNDSSPKGISIKSQPPTVAKPPAQSDNSFKDMAFPDDEPEQEPESKGGWFSRSRLSGITVRPRHNPDKKGSDLIL